MMFQTKQLSTLRTEAERITDEAMGRAPEVKGPRMINIGSPVSSAQVIVNIGIISTSGVNITNSIGPDRKYEYSEAKRVDDKKEEQVVASTCCWPFNKCC